MLDGGNKLIFGDSGDNHLKPIHEGPSGQGVVSQLRFQFWED